MLKNPVVDGAIADPNLFNEMQFTLVFDDQVDLVGHWPRLTDADLSNAEGQIKHRVSQLYNALLVQHTSGLGVQWTAGVLRLANGTTLPIPGSVATLPDNATTYFYVRNGGTTVERGASIPANALRLAIAITADGAVTSITDLRASLLVPFDTLHGALSEQTQDLRDRLDTLTAATEATTAAQDQVLDDIAALQTGLTSTQSSVATLQAGLTSTQSSVADLQARPPLANYTIQTGTAFSVSPGSKVAYNGLAAATATIAAGATPGQSIEIANLSDFAVTISAAGMDVNGTVIPAGASAVYIWNGAGQYEAATVSTSSSSSGGGSTPVTPPSWNIDATSWSAVQAAWIAVSNAVTGGWNRTFTTSAYQIPQKASGEIDYDQRIFTGSQGLYRACLFQEILANKSPTALTPLVSIQKNIATQLNSTVIPLGNDNFLLWGYGLSSGARVLSIYNAFTKSEVMLASGTATGFFIVNAWLKGSDLYVIGGSPTTILPFLGAYRYDLNTQVWTTIGTVVEVTGNYAYQGVLSSNHIVRFATANGGVAGFDYNTGTVITPVNNTTLMGSNAGEPRSGISQNGRLIVSVGGNLQSFDANYSSPVQLLAGVSLEGRLQPLPDGRLVGVVNTSPRRLVFIAKDGLSATTEVPSITLDSGINYPVLDPQGYPLFASSGTTRRLDMGFSTQLPISVIASPFFNRIP